MTLEQVKKLILTTNFAGLTEDEFIEKVVNMIKAEIDNPALVPGLTPAPDDVQAKVDEIKTLKQENKQMKQKQKDNTGKIKDLKKDIKNDLTSKWANQAQNAPGMDKNKAALLGFGSKGLDDGHSEPSVNINNSNPEIAIVDASRHLQLMLTIHNNVTGKIGLPKDAKGIDIYMFMGKDEPVDFRKSGTYVGRAKRGKRTIKFAEDQMGLIVWFYVIYVPRNAGDDNLVASKVKTVVS
jgi:hypothetical protein